MLKNPISPGLGMILLLVMAGCSGPNPPERKTLDLTLLPDYNMAEAMTLAQTVLGKLNFTIEKADIHTGVLTTHPLSGAQFFEFWRDDAVGRFHALESNLHSIRRIVELSISEQDKDTVIRCVVRTERLNMPGNPTANQEAYLMLSNSSQTVQRLKLSPYQEENMMWTDLGPDYELAQKITALIKQESLKQKITQG